MYTHYWKPKEAKNQKAWDDFVFECKRLLVNLPKYSQSAGGYYSDEPIKICSYYGTGLPEMNGEMIHFNGDVGRGLDHESFYIKPFNVESGFCKTSRKPYDLLVCACLIGAHDMLDYEVTSDGDIDDWKPAIKFYIKNIYDFTDTPTKEKREILEHVLPEFLKSQLKGRRTREFVK